MTHQLTLTVRALRDARGGVVIRTPAFLLINMSTVDEGKAVGIVTVDFQGDELPTPTDLTRDLLIVGNWTHHPRHGTQFAVSAWAATGSTPAPPAVRHKRARKLSADQIRRLTGKD